jgi:hypothetical protein
MAKILKPDNNLSSMDGTIDAALDIAKHRRETLHRLRAALKDKNVAEVFQAAEELCGISHDDETSHRVN